MHIWNFYYHVILYVLYCTFILLYMTNCILRYVRAPRHQSIKITKQRNLKHRKNYIAPSINGDHILCQVGHLLLKLFHQFFNQYKCSQHLM